jgi:PAT family beta-lactamase induction signal transducer AmpG
VVASRSAAFVAGWLMPRICLMSGLLIGTVAGSASHLALVLAAHGGDGGNAFWTFALAVGIEGFAYAFASVVLITYMSTLASVEHAASQFGLLTSLCAFPGSILAGGLRGRAYGLRMGFHLDLIHRHPGRAAGVFVWYRVGISDEALIRVSGGHQSVYERIGCHPTLIMWF